MSAKEDLQYLLFSDDRGPNDIYGFFFEDVSNIKELLTKAKAGEFNVCLINPRVIIDVFQLQVAVAKAISNERNKSMVTRALSSEILYSLSPSTKINDCFSKIGINDKIANVIAVVLEEPEGGIENLIKGRMIGMVEGIGKHGDVTHVTKLYSVLKEEATSSTLIDSIVTRTAAKTLM